jgi:phosphate transport system substrate-binding protein
MVHTCKTPIFWIAMAGVLAASAHPVRAETVRIAGTGSGEATMRLLADAFHKGSTQTKIVVLPTLGSAGGINALLAGAADIAVTGRPLRKEELERGLVAVEYGRTPLVFATRAGSRSENITREELAEFYSAKRTAWPDGTPVRLVLRTATDSDTQLIKSLSPAIGEAVAAAARRPGMTVAIGDRDAADAIERLSGSLGAATLALIIAERRAVKVLKLDGVEPSLEAVAQGRYPLFRTLHLVTVREPTPRAKEFLSFVRSKAGQALLEQTGHLPSLR